MCFIPNRESLECLQRELAITAVCPPARGNTDICSYAVTAGTAGQEAMALSLLPNTHRSRLSPTQPEWSMSDRGLREDIPTSFFQNFNSFLLRDCDEKLHTVNNGELSGYFQLCCVDSRGILWRLCFNFSGFHLIFLQ